MPPPKDAARDCFEWQSKVFTSGSRSATIAPQRDLSSPSSNGRKWRRCTLSSRFDFPNFVGLLFILAAIALWAGAAFAFLAVQLTDFFIYTVIGFVMSIAGGYLLKPPGSR